MPWLIYLSKCTLFEVETKYYACFSLDTWHRARCKQALASVEVEAGVMGGRVGMGLSNCPRRLQVGVPV